LNEAATAPLDEVIRFPQLSTARTWSDAATPTVTVLVGSVNELGWILIGEQEPPACGLGDVN